ncbi:DUF2065 domain-containing protein [Tabrizicola sp.]|uniref:DUF2065 domain-containing protein n=1 Tax=Tabrizicola sp. TaxID=2005166 RepID=UPI0025F959B8|nr:DUF2065 domain-containing protein [Tabrizicola sp.]MBY0350348.1 DUF2065 domain-containing protein [Tabrizicola sp.]MDK2774687.1 DUF2065 domain-containing protein [Tabrizicola sp.]
MSDLVLALGLVLAVEGLVLALTPRRVEDALRMIAVLGIEQRRLIGLGALALGIVIVWLARGA